MTRSSVFYTAAFSLLLTLFSCKKKTEIVNIQPVESAPIATALLVNGGFNVTATGSGNYEYGTKFQVTKAGKILRLACKMPTAGTYRVTLWDADSKAQLAQANVTATAGTLSFGSITAVAATPGKNYIVTLWSNTNWYEIRPIGGGVISYPLTSGNVKLTGYQWIGTAQTPITFPTNAETTYVAGVADIEFQAD